MANNQWSSGLFGCFNDCGSCCLGSCLPCILSGQISDKLGDGFMGQCMLSFCCGYWPCVGAALRRRVRDKYGLGAEPCGDCILHCFCGPCGSCQEAREVDYRINLSRQAPQAQAPPMVHVQPSPQYDK